MKRQAVDVLRKARRFGITRACGLVGISRSLYGYRGSRAVIAGLQERMVELASVKRRYGYRRIYLMLRREGWRVNRKRIYRLYRTAEMPAPIIMLTMPAARAKGPPAVGGTPAGCP